MLFLSFLPPATAGTVRSKSASMKRSARLVMAEDWGIFWLLARVEWVREDFLLVFSEILGRLGPWFMSCRICQSLLFWRLIC